MQTWISTRRSLRFAGIWLGALLLLTTGGKGQPAGAPETLQGDLTIFHAGSLSIPMRMMTDIFEAEHPRVKVYLEAAGSRLCARKICELGRKCDLFASADYTVIDQLLIPEFATWNIPLVTNEMVLAYHNASRYSDQINSDNWYRILQRDDVVYGRSDPDSDPCGYRSVLAIQLAEQFYEQPGLTATLLAKDREAIRPRETHLLALLEVGQIDYLFIYRSVAWQHGLEILSLPPEIDLGAPEHEAFYATASVEILGRKPGTTITKRGQAMLYGVTIPTDPPHPVLAEAFLHFLLDPEGGLRILAEQGQASAVPTPTTTWSQLPPQLRRYALPPGGNQD